MSRVSGEKKEKGLADQAVGKKALRIVSPDVLQVDPSYQRGLVSRHKLIVKKFDPDALGVPLVGQRDDGSLWVVDGQQRVGALKILGKKTVRVDVFASRGPEHEAHVFKLVNRNRTGLSSVEMFKALLAEGDKDAHAVKEIVEKAGFRVARQHGVGFSADENRAKEIACINTLMDVYTRTKCGGAVAARFILDTIAAAWPDDPLRVKIEVVGGLGVFYAQMGGTADVEGGALDPDRLVSRLQLTTPAKLIYSASLGAGGRYENVAEVVSKMYRKRSGKRT